MGSSREHIPTIPTTIYRVAITEVTFRASTIVCVSNNSKNLAWSHEISSARRICSAIRSILIDVSAIKQAMIVSQLRTNAKATTNFHSVGIGGLKMIIIIAMVWITADTNPTDFMVLARCLIVFMSA